MIGTSLRERYELTAELGRGGTGVVYLARDAVLGRDVAVKVISTRHCSEDHVERFQREARLAAQLDHPAIAPIYDFGRHGETLFLVMPVLAGQTLHSLLRDGALRLGEVLEIVVRVAEALDYSASRGVVHRDVKPENIMVARHGEGEMRAWVMDFGLALEASSRRITKTGQLPGTLSYLSPEHVLSLDLDGRSDLYSLGTILYESLAGEPPFTGSQGSVLYRIVHEPPSPPDWDEALDALVLRCLAKLPEERPQRGRELADALRRYRASGSGGAERRPLPRARSLRRPATAPWVGRREEMAELRRRLRAALAGECQLVLVSGEVGSGKTRLLAELERLARDRRVAVLRGRFPSRREAFPYQGFCELIQDYFRGRGAGSTSGGGPPPELGDLAEELVALFPALGEVPELCAAAGQAAVPAADPTSIFELLARALARLAAGRPAVLLLESLDQAEEASLDALLYALRRLGPTPTLIAATCRHSGGRQHPLHHLLRGLDGDPRCAALTLGPLAADDHRQMVASLLAPGSGTAPFEPEVAAMLYEKTEGNPFFTLELVRSLLGAGDLRRGGDGSWELSGNVASLAGALPGTIQQAVETRLERLPDELRQILEAAAVLGRGFDLRDLRALAGEVEELDEAIDQLLRERFLEEDRRSRGDRLCFASGMVRDVLAASLTRRRRRRLHHRAALALERRYAGRPERIYPLLVHHFSEADVADETVRYALLQARRSAAAFSPGDTLHAARIGLELVADSALEAEGELRLLRVSALRLEGRLESAAREVERALAACERAGEVEAAADACLAAAEISWQLRRVEATRHWLDEGLERARGAGTEGCLGRLLSFAATVANLSGERDKARLLLREAAGLEQRADASADEPELAGGTLRTTLPSPPTTSDPVLSRSLEDAEVLSNVFEPLLASDAAGNLIPRLCTKWSGEAGGTRFEVTLHRDVRFSDGCPLTAARAKRALEASARRGAAQRGAARRGAAQRGAGALAEAFSALGGIEAVDEHRLVFHLRQPLPLFPALLTDLRTALARPGAGGELLGTGPFVLAAGGEGEVVLERNPEDWRAVPARLDRVELATSLDAGSCARRLRAGQLDVGRNLTPEDLEEVLRDPRFRRGLVEAPKKNVYFALWNRFGPGARLPEVRRALSGVVRPQDLVWRTLGRFAQPACCLIPPGILGHDAGRRPAILPESAAAQLLRAAALSPPALRVAVHPLFLDRYRSLLEALFEKWSALGVRAEVTTASMESYLAAWEDNADVDLLIARWVPDYDDPDNLTYVPFHSVSGSLRRYVADRGLDRLMLQARHEQRTAVRQRLYRKIESWLADRDLLLPLFHDIDYRIAGPGVRGWDRFGTPPYVSYARLCRAPPPAPVAAAGSSVLRYPITAAFDSLEPTLALLSEPAEVIPNVFETLMRVGRGAAIEPHLAQSLRQVDGGRRYLLRLRRGVRFHDGRRLSSRDVRYSFERLLRSPALGAAETLSVIRGAGAFRAGSADELAGLAVTAADELSIELERPAAFFAALLTDPMTAIVPEGIRDFGGNWRSGCAGTGPFRLVRLEAGRRVELEANPHYWRPGHPRCGRLVFELAVAPGEMAAGLRSGHFSGAAALPPADAAGLRRESRLAAGLRESPGFSTYFLILSCHRGPFAERRLRRAFRRALAAWRPPGGVAARGLIPPGLLGAEQEPPAPATEEDLALLRGVRLAAMAHPAYCGQYAESWRGLRRLFAELGLEVAVEELGGRELGGSSGHAEVDCVALRRMGSYPDPDAFVAPLHSRFGPLGALLGEPRVDALIERGRGERDAELRHGIYRELERLLAREAFVVPLFDEHIVSFAQPEVRGLRLRLGWPRIAYDELSVER